MEQHLVEMVDDNLTAFVNAKVSKEVEQVNMSREGECNCVYLSGVGKQWC